MATILGLVCIVLILIILFQISRASDMVVNIKGEESVSERNNTIHGMLFLIFLVVGMGLAFWSTWYYSDRFLPMPSSDHGIVLENMFFWTLVATVPVFVITHILLFYFSWRYRGRKDRHGFYFPHSNKLELLWTAIPAVVLVLLVFEGLRGWLDIMGPAPKQAMVVEATAQQFQWTIRYSGKDNKLGKKSIKEINGTNGLGLLQTQEGKDDFVADELHLPVNQPVLVRINSKDVLHNFYLPHFDVKMDAVPGIPTQFWFTPNKTTAEMREELGNPEFNYELACAELCGQAHFNMRKVVVIEEEAAFKKWLGEQTPIFSDLGWDTTPEKNIADKDQEGEDKVVSTF